MNEHSATIIDGKGIAEQWLGDVAAQVRALEAPLHLAAVLIGDDEGLKKFVALKQKAAAKCGIQFSAYYPEDEKETKELLSWLAQDKAVHGMFVELPLPEDFSEERVLSLIPREKDVDLITPAGEQSFYGDTAAILPPAVSALRRVLGELDIDPAGMNAAVVGQGKLIGKPITHWLARQGSTVSAIDIDTGEPAKIASRAELLVSGTGVPGLITDAWIKKDAVIIDYGYGNRDGEYVGDVDVESVKKKAGTLTPVPGGMGPLVVAATMDNLLNLSLSNG